MALVFTPSRFCPETRIVFRVDGNARIGLGHRTRCLSLARRLEKEGFDWLLATRDPLDLLPLPGPRRQHWPVPAELPRLAEPAWLAERLAPTDILVLDGYDFDAPYQQLCKQQTRALVCFDDFAAAHVWGDVIINAAGGLTSAHYAAREPGAQLCLGPGYALLRASFWQVRERVRGAPDTNRIFLNMGGADPDNHTLRLLPALRARFPGRHLSVVTGAAYPHQRELSAAAAGNAQVRLHHDLGERELAELLRRCGVYVCPPSGMAYECCAIGGLLLLHPTADNQQLLFDYLTRAGLALPYAQLGALPDDELPALAASLRTAQRQLFNPEETAHRFQRVFRDLQRTYRLQVRHATRADAALYLSWANDPAVRANAIHPEPIAWPGHLAWFERRLADPDSYLYLFAEDGVLVGQVRIEFAESEGTIDYSVAAAWRGQGLGQALLRRALTELRRERPTAWRLRGEVKTTNLASARVFERLGFARLGPVERREALFEQFELAVAAVPSLR